jgi:hypothetical protein
MLRTLAAITFGFAIAISAVAAPVPPRPEKERIAKYWGKTEGEGEFELKDGRLTMRTIGKPARGVFYRDSMNMPRATRTVTGDFEATVTVTDAALPAAKHKHEDAWPGTRAGLFVRGGDCGVELHFYQYFSKINGVQKEEPTRYVWVDTWFQRGGAGSSLRSVEAGKTPHLRITRKGQDIAVSHSIDGKEWSKPHTPRQNLEFPDEVTVGVFFAHSTYQIAAATFEGFTITKPKDGK